MLDDTQQLHISTKALRHLVKHRQCLPWQKEAGGQLFGGISATQVTVELAVGPNGRDDRGRYHFRSDPATAQSNIARFYRKGLLYLGEWHTHAEAFPKVSQDDRNAMSEIYARSSLNVSSLILLIRGTDCSLAGLSAFYYSAGLLKAILLEEG